MAQLRLICFDFDGTLAYMHPTHWATYAEAARDAGIDLSEAALASPGVDRAWDPWLTPQGVAHPDASTSAAAFREVRVAIAMQRMRDAGAQVDDATLRAAAERAATLEADASRFRLFDDTRPALARIAAAGTHALIISNHLWELPEIVDALDLGPMLAGVVTSARAGYRKPHPEIYREALRQAGVEAHEALMVGDSITADVYGAQDAGLHAVFLDRDHRTDIPDGVRTIHSLLEVPLTWP